MEKTAILSPSWSLLTHLFTDWCFYYYCHYYCDNWRTLCVRIAGIPEPGREGGMQSWWSFVGITVTTGVSGIGVPLSLLKCYVQRPGINCPKLVGWREGAAAAGTWVTPSGLGQPQCSCWVLRPWPVGAPVCSRRCRNLVPNLSHTFWKYNPPPKWLLLETVLSLLSRDWRQPDKVRW